MKDNSLMADSAQWACDVDWMHSARGSLGAEAEYLSCLKG